MNAFWSFLAELALKLVGPVLAFFCGKEHAEKKEAEQHAEQSKKEAQRWANAPNTDADFDRMLSDRINRKRKAENDD